MVKKLKDNNLIIMFCLAVICNIFCSNEMAFFMIGISINIVYFLYGRHGKILLKDIYILCFLMIFCLVIVVSKQDAKLFKILELIFMALCYQSFMKCDHESFLNQIKKLNSIIVFGACTFGTYELIMRYNPLIRYFQKDYISDLFGMSQYRVCNIYSHPIIYAHLLLIAFFVTLFTYKRGIAKKIILLLIGIQLLFTQTRSAWIIFAIAVMVLMLRKHKIPRKKLSKIIFTVLLTICLLLFLNYEYGFTQIIADRFLYLKADNVSFTQRIGSIAIIIKSYFSGNIFQIFFGFGNRASAYLMRSITISIAGFSTTDNQYISLIYNFGVCALLFLVDFFIKLIKIRKCSDICFFTMICSVGMMFFYEGLYWPIVYVVMAFFYAEVVRLCSRKK